MVESLSDYQEALTNFSASRERYSRLETEVKQLDTRVFREKTRLSQAYDHLNALRYQKVYTLLEEAGLGVCSAEIITWEFHDDDHRKIAGLIMPENLGIFPVGQLRFLYFQGPGYDNTPYNEQSYTKEFTLLLCHHHFPKDPEQEVTFRDVPSYVPKLITSELTLSGNKFINNKGQEVKALYPQTPLPEPIFEYFKIPALPKIS